ncbi:hypothetical protein ACVOMV_27220 (plasmid) [Mesorhizobium atlanticum]
MISSIQHVTTVSMPDLLSSLAAINSLALQNTIDLTDRRPANLITSFKTLSRQLKDLKREQYERAHCPQTAFDT